LVAIAISTSYPRIRAVSLRGFDRGSIDEAAQTDSLRYVMNRSRFFYAAAQWLEKFGEGSGEDC
jgi:hypothetical protein